MVCVCAGAKNHSVLIQPNIPMHSAAKTFVNHLVRDNHSSVTLSKAQHFVRVFCCSVSKCAYTYRSVDISVCVVCVCVRAYIFTTAIAYVSRGFRSIILYFYAISSHTTVTSPILPFDCGLHRNRIRHGMKSNLLLSSETCNQITTKLHDKL